MEFTHFHLTNFGQYNGEHQIDVSTSNDQVSQRPIILIGGKNGAGKTTLLEAVKLCLYGAASLGEGVRRATYEAYLDSRIYRKVGAPIAHTFAWVGVGFQHTLGGVTSRFEVRRSWQRQRRTLDETLQIWRDGVALRDDEAGWWDQFLYDVLPPGLANLFFFDGERIQTLADAPDHVALAESVRTLLGLDGLSRVRNDLALYMTRQRRNPDSGLEAQLASLTPERTEIEQGFAAVHTTLAGIRRELAQLRGKIEAEERLLASEGGNIANQRATLSQRAESLRATKQRHERTIVEYAHGLLPFALVPHLCQNLAQRLRSDAILQQQQSFYAVGTHLTEATLQRLANNDTWLGDVALQPDQREALLAGIAATFATTLREFAPAADVAPMGLHDLAHTERANLLTWLDESTTTIPATLIELNHMLATINTELARIETTLQQSPVEDVLTASLRRIAALEREYWATEAREREQEIVLHQWQTRRDAIKIHEQEIYTKMLRGDDPTRRIDLATRAAAVLRDYENALQRRKIAQLETAIADCFGRLSRKGRYIQRVQINPTTWETLLFNHKGDALLKHQLSAGEKQLYAVALVWALRVVSGRQLPLIIDTPLGRLDSDHRTQMATQFFPHASHQVVLLSTDTEIDATLWELLQNITARTYQVVFRSEYADTTIVPGYFWEQAPLADEVVLA